MLSVADVRVGSTDTPRGRGVFATLHISIAVEVPLQMPRAYEFKVASNLASELWRKIYFEFESALKLASITLDDPNLSAEEKVRRFNTLIEKLSIAYHAALHPEEPPRLSSLLDPPQ